MIQTGMGVGLILMLFWTPYLLAKGVNKLSSGEDKLSFGEHFLCALPLVNTIRAEVQWFGKIAFHTIATFLMIAFTAFRIVVYMKMFDNKTMTQVSIYCFIAGAVLFILSHMFLVWRIMSDSDDNATVKSIIFGILFPFGQYYIGNYLGNVVRHNQKKVRQFDAEYDEDDDYDDEGYDDGYYEG